MPKRQKDPRRTLVECLISKSRVLALIGDTQQSLAIANEGLVHAACSDDRRLVVDCLLQVNSVYNDISRFDELSRNAKLCLPLCQATGYVDGIARCYGWIGVALDNSGKYHQAIESYSKSAEIRRAEGNWEEYAISLMDIGVSYSSLGLYREAEVSYQQALAIAERVSAIKTQASLMQNIAHIRHGRGEYRQALDMLSRCLAINERIGDRSSQSYTLHEIGYIHHVLGDDGQALRCLRESERIKEETGDLWSLTCSLNLITRIDTASGELEEADRYLAKGDAVAAKVGNLDLFCRLAVARGELALARDEITPAYFAKNRALELAEQAGLKHGKAEAMLLWARIDAARGDHRNAWPRFQNALALFQEMNSMLDQGIAKYHYGRSMNETGRTGDAKGSLNEAAVIFRGIGAATWLQRAERTLAGIPS